MACLILNKFLCCIKLRIGVIIMGILFMIWKLIILYNDGSIFIIFANFLIDHRNADVINIPFDSRVTLVYGGLHLILNIIDIILTILLAIGLFKEKQIRFVKVFYDGVIGTLVLNVVIFAVVAYILIERLKVKVTNEMRLLMIAEYVVGTVLMIYFIIVTRSYHYKKTHEKPILVTHTPRNRY